MDGTPDSLVAAAVDALAAEYVRCIDPARLGGPLLGATMYLYFDGHEPEQFAQPLVFHTRRKLEHCVAAGEIDDVWQLWDPPGFSTEVDPAGALTDPAVRAPVEALRRHIVDHDDFSLYDRVIVAVCRRLADAWGLVVVADDGMDVGAESRRALVEHGLGPEESARWAAQDWLPRDRRGDRALAGEVDVVLYLRLADDRVSGVYRQPSGGLFIAATLVAGGGGTGLQAGRVVSEGTGDGRTFVGGLAPAGAVIAEVQDLWDCWHPCRLGGGAWIGVLPHPDRGGPPAVVFRDASGAEIADPATVAADDGPAGWTGEERAKIKRAVVPALWARELPGRPRLTGWGEGSSGSGLTSLTLSGGGVEVTLRMIRNAEWDLEASARDALESALGWDEGRRAAARIAIDAAVLDLSVTMNGKAVAAAAVSGARRWVVVAVDQPPTVAVHVSGSGAPPATMTLREP